MIETGARLVGLGGVTLRGAAKRDELGIGPREVVEKLLLIPSIYLGILPE